VLAGRVKPESLRNRIVVVGASAPSLQDVHAVSAGGRDLMSGAEVQANAIATMLNRLPLRDAGVPIDVLLLFGLAMAAPLASLRWGPRGSLLLAVLVGIGFAGACQLAFTRGLVISAVYPLLALVLGALGALAVHYLTGAYERERMRELFSRFVPEQVVGAALDCTDDDLRLGAERRVATVMFCDLRGFTSFAETRPPDVVIDVLNRYLSGMTDAIMEHGGTLVSYMGDGIMAVFGAPLTQRDHADRALAAARLMLDERLPAFNEWLVDEGHAEDGFRMGIGLNSGYVYSGNVGSDRRVEYTAVGDTTNVAARLETMTKGTPHQLFIADSTRRLLRTSHPELAAVDELTVIGRQGTLKVWTLAAAAAPLHEASAQAA
jgi:adenylate cyclase